MSWYIDQKVNNGYPFNQSFPTTFNTTWYASGDIQLPINLWRIINNINDGYPCTAIIPPSNMQTYFKSEFGGVQVPHAIWRLTPSVNEDYPYIWWWFKEDTETDEGTIETEHSPMDIGGSQSNYPPFTSSDKGGVRPSMNNGDMADLIKHNPQSDQVNAAVASALSRKIFVCTDALIQQTINQLNKPDLLASASKSIIQEVFGANVYDGIVACKVFPLNIHLKQEVGVVPGIFGLWPLTDISDKTQRLFPMADTVQYVYDMGTCVPSLRQAWEYEFIEWNIYLPYAGTYPLDMRSSAPLHLLLSVDYISGVSEYILLQNNQVQSIFKCQLGWDFPIIPTRGQIANNALAFASHSIAQGLSLVSQGALAATAPVGKAALTAEAKFTGAISGQATSNLGNFSTQHYAVTSPSIGGLVGMASYPTPRLIAKIPQMHLEALGYSELLGVNRSMAVERVDECSGYIVCENYHTDVIQCTTQEKELISSLMNSGVFV